MDKLLGAKIGILGLGTNNWGLFNWLLKHQARSVTICDKNPQIQEKVLKSGLGKKAARVRFQLGRNYLQKLENFEVVIRTPGLRARHPKLLAAREKGVKITSQTQLFFDFCPAKIIGITGTKGKGTTANLLFRILMKKFIGSRADCYLAGNIGTDPFDFLDQLKSEDEVIYELSSFQLQDMRQSPQIGIVLNITQDHLDYHRNQQEYLKAKYPILAYQNSHDTAIVNSDYFSCLRLAGLSPASLWQFSTQKPVKLGVYVQKGQIFIQTKNRQIELGPIDKLKLKGQHNLENILAASLAGYILGVKPWEIRRVITTFGPLPHRLEPVLESRGVVIINDSYSTNPQTTMAALEAYPQAILIVGGRSKRLGFNQLAKVMVQKAKKVIVMGENQSQIRQAVLRQGFDQSQLFEVQDLSQAVARAFEQAQANDVILFSPASASFDQFKNASERGRAFKDLIFEHLK